MCSNEPFGHNFAGPEPQSTRSIGVLVKRYDCLSSINQMNDLEINLDCV